MKLLHNKNYWFASGYLLTFFAAWSMWWSFYAIWLKSSIGLNGAEVGIVYAINSAVSMIFMILYGVIQDKLDLKKHAVTFQGIIMICIAPFLIYVYEPLLQSNFILGVIIGAPILSAGFISGCGLCESYVERISRRIGFEYGSTRFWGSFGYAGATFIAGILFSTNPHYNFYFSSVLGGLFLVINFFFKPNTGTHINNNSAKIVNTPKLSEILALFKMKKFWVLTFFIMGTYSLYLVYDQQLFPNFYTSFFSKGEDGFKIYGYLNSFQVFLEATMMLVMPFVIHKIGAKNAIILAALIMVLRILGSAYFNDIYLISCIKLFHAIEIPLFILSIFKYIVTHFEERFSATIFATAFLISQQIGVILLSGLTGRLFDSHGYSTTFYTLAVTVIIIAVVGFMLLETDKSRSAQTVVNS
ncbi:oligosaccharide MFS transporter [Brenneria sp. 4F2]|nr:oligosaccharide MFS transporter [Brenneria bubanii]